MKSSSSTTPLDSYSLMGVIDDVDGEGKTNAGELTPRSVLLFN